MVGEKKEELLKEDSFIFLKFLGITLYRGYLPLGGRGGMEGGGSPFFYQKVWEFSLGYRIAFKKKTKAYQEKNRFVLPIVAHGERRSYRIPGLGRQ